ncbi:MULTISPECIES: type-F conjugative transfer system pilin assembly protein TrbC [Vibrio]|uniref:Type-F conjugative transfer system pilin assembly protein TrbC n=1 Tax=Vibrio mediterranei TaxID=689 RepID=A0AAN1FMR3_9VIBR|nr:MULTISPECIES: type-F conjugative transfer system pilin assembly protein TrbC [Vibrio]ASI93424.1 type-F conjugative transfer system pilin assembly protein TrbC [Vibrio mediterranei]
MKRLSLPLLTGLLTALLSPLAISRPNVDTSLEAALDELSTLPAQSLQTPDDVQRFLNNLQAQHAPAGAQTAPPLQIFVSLSMPQSSLIPLLRQASELGAPVMIRGVLPQGFKATIDAVYQLMAQMQQQHLPPLGGVSIDPHAFTAWHVTRVPTFVLQETETSPSSPTESSPAEASQAEPGRADRLVGNLTPMAALKQFAISGEHSELARSLLDTLKTRSSQNPSETTPPSTGRAVTVFRSQ